MMMQFPEKILTFLNTAPSVDIGYGGFTFFQPEALEKAQVGYSIDATNNSLLKGIEGEWQKEWIVIGLDDLVGDPIFVDTTTSSFTVMTAEHALAWSPYPIADSLENFATLVTQLLELSINRNTPEEFEKNPLSEKEKEVFVTSVASANPNSEIEYWEGFLDLKWAMC